MLSSIMSVRLPARQQARISSWCNACASVASCFVVMCGRASTHKCRFLCHTISNTLTDKMLEPAAGHCPTQLARHDASTHHSSQACSILHVFAARCMTHRCTSRPKSLSAAQWQLPGPWCSQCCSPEFAHSQPSRCASRSSPESCRQRGCASLVLHYPTYTIVTSCRSTLFSRTQWEQRMSTHGTDNIGTTRGMIGLVVVMVNSSHRLVPHALRAVR